jgi:hypothetical protein
MLLQIEPNTNSRLIAEMCKARIHGGAGQQVVVILVVGGEEWW